MGEGDDDTNKPVHAAILIQDGKQGKGWPSWSAGWSRARATREFF